MEEQSVERVYIEITQAGQSLQCSDANPNDFSQLVRVEVTIDRSGSFGGFYSQTPVLKVGEGLCLIEIYKIQGKDTAIWSKAPVIVQPAFKDMAPLGEGLVGVDVNAASSTSPQAVFLGLGVFDLPLEKLDFFSTADKYHQRQKRRLWLSGELGLKGMAQPGAVSGAASVGYFATAANATPDKIVQSVNVSLHCGWQFYSWHIPIGTFDSEKAPGGSEQARPTTLATLSFIGGGGAITPLSASQSNPQVFEATPLILQTQTPISPMTSFPSTCGQTPSTQCYVIFLPSDRTHFYRYYNGGLRLKLYARDYADNELRFPAILDLTVGQNEYVTGGKMHGAVLHTGGSLPFPHLDSVYIFGSFDLGLSFINGGGPELQLIPAPVTAGVTATSPSVFTISTSQPNRDRYELGFGIDVFHLFSKYFKSGKPAQSQGSQSQSP